MARILHLVWEVAQQNAITLPYSPNGGDVRTFVAVEDYRVSGNLLKYKSNF